MLTTVRDLLPIAFFALAAVVAAGCGGTAHNDRPTAEWVLEQGGTVTVQGDDTELAEPQDLPPNGFVLQAINLNETGIGDDELQNLSDARYLQTLGLYGTEVTDDGLDHILNIKSLTELELSYTQISDEGLNKLARLPNLKTLYLTGTRVTDEGLEGLRQRRPGCKVFRF